MSITFWVPEAEMVTVEADCPACDGTGKYGDEACLYCDGTGSDTIKESILPHLNMSNYNALAFLKALDQEQEYCGTWEVDMLPVIETKLMLIQMGTSVMLEEQSYAVGNFHHCGRDNDYVQSRAEAMLKVVQAARKSCMAVSWG